MLSMLLIFVLMMRVLVDLLVLLSKKLRKNFKLLTFKVFFSSCSVLILYDAVYSAIFLMSTLFYY